MDKYLQMKFDKFTCTENFNNKNNIVKVSVIIPIYNVEKYIKKCLDSLINQSLKEVEFICIDDGSTDNSIKYLNEYIKNDGRFIVITQKNQGQGVARNNGIKRAKGEYIAFVDPDDWVDKNLLEYSYNFAKKNDAQVVQFNYKKFNNSSKKRYKTYNFAKKLKKEQNLDISKTKKYNKNDIKNGIFYDLDLHVWNRLYKTNLIKSNNISFAPTKNGEDHLFVNGALIFADNIYYLDKNLYFYRVRKESIVNTLTYMNGIYAFEDINYFKKFLEKKNLYKKFELEFRKYCLKILIWHYFQLPQENIAEYEKWCKEYLTEKEFKEFKVFIHKKNSFFQKILSLKNKKGEKMKISTLLRLNFKPKEKSQI